MTHLIVHNHPYLSLTPALPPKSLSNIVTTTLELWTRNTRASCPCSTSPWNQSIILVYILPAVHGTKVVYQSIFYQSMELEYSILVYILPVHGTIVVYQSIFYQFMELEQYTGLYSTSPWNWSSILVYILPVHGTRVVYQSIFYQSMELEQSVYQSIFYQSM